MRGKVVYQRIVLDDTRITPAYAGKSFFVKPRFSRSRDHPRLCGEKGKSSTRTRSELGSPPPMRGKD